VKKETENKNRVNSMFFEYKQNIRQHVYLSDFETSGPGLEP